MNHPLDPVLWPYLRRVQRLPRVGMHARSHERGEICARTVYRWQRRFGDQLLIIPSVAVERLGLVHCHVLVTTPGDEWLSLPYVVEACWLTPDLCRDTLYLHCLVPTDQQVYVQSLARTLRCAASEVVWSGTGWQQFVHAGEPIEIPIAAEVVADRALLQRHPFLIPVVMESWRHPNSLPLIWDRARSTLQERLRSFLPRTRIHYTNGSSHVTTAFQVLDSEELLRQHIIRYHPLLAASIEVLLDIQVGRTDLLVLLEGWRSLLHAVETYPTPDGFFCRLLGPHRLIDAMLGLPESLRSRIRRLLFHTKRHPATRVRFAYDRLFNPTTGVWEVPA
jgi:hypothetical protein